MNRNVAQARSVLVSVFARSDSVSITGCGATQRNENRFVKAPLFVIDAKHIGVLIAGRLLRLPPGGVEFFVGRNGANQVPYLPIFDAIDTIFTFRDEIWIIEMPEEMNVAAVVNAMRCIQQRRCV